MIINTEKLKSLVNKAYKCVSNNKLIPLTELMCFDFDGERLMLTTSNDNGDYLYVECDAIVKQEPLYVTVYAEPFVKIVNKITSQDIELTLKDEVLHIKGNGNYKIGLPPNADGGVIEYPDPLSTVELNYTTAITLSAIDTILDVNKSALAKTLENPVYSNYYFGDKVITTDGYKICSTDLNLFNTPIMLSKTLVDLLSVFTKDEIDVMIDDDMIVFSDGDCTIYGHIEEDIDDFEIEPISALLGTEIDSMCQVDKSSLLATLDRLSLFVSPYDNNIVTLNFTDNALEVYSMQDTGIESIRYEGSSNAVDYTCRTNIILLQEQIRAVTSDVVNIYYNNDKVIKIVNDDVTLVLAVMS